MRIWYYGRAFGPEIIHGQVEAATWQEAVAKAGNEGKGQSFWTASDPIVPRDWDKEYTVGKQ